MVWVGELGRNTYVRTSAKTIVKLTHGKIKIDNNLNIKIYSSIKKDFVSIMNITILKNLFL
jgi:hypothetical protein